MKTTFTRRDTLKGAAALASATMLAAPVRAQVTAKAPPASAITPALIEAARKEGKVVWYTSIDLAAAERVAKTFEAKFPGVAVRVERNGAERLFQRIGQEYSSKIFSVDVVNTSDAAHVITWKRNGWLAPYVPEDVAKHFPAEHKDADGAFASVRVTLCPIAYNTNLVKKEEAPKSYADLLDPKWSGKIVKAHPSYSGTILTATYQIARDIGWPYFEKLAQQKIMQVQSATDPPKKLALGERAIMADGGEYVALQHKEKGDPIETRLSGGGNAADRRAERAVPERAEPECGAAAAKLHVHRRRPAGDDRFRRHAFGPSANQAAAWPHAAQGHQADEGRRRCRRARDRGDQEALHANLQSVIMLAQQQDCHRPRRRAIQYTPVVTGCRAFAGHDSGV